MPLRPVPSPLLRWAGLLLPLSALAIVLFYALAWLRDNRAPVVDLAGYRDGGTALVARVERCVLAPQMVMVRGWAVRRGEEFPRQRARVVILDARGVARELDTAWLPREDLGPALKQALGDGRLYRVPGFAASLDLRRIPRPASPVRMALAWQEGDARLQVPLACQGHLP